MIHSVALFIVISIQLLALVTSYDFNLNTCSASFGQQSPVNVDSKSSLYFDEKYFRFLSNAYEFLTPSNNWTYLSEERAIGIVPHVNQTDLGNFVFVKDWAMYTFDLKKILFRVNSEHQIDGQSFDAEMQFVHTIDNNFYPPGKRISLGVNYLVISIFFKVTEDKDPAASKLFEFMNLQGFANGTSTGLSRNIKLHYMVQHQPAYLYQGTLTFPECEPALWMLFSQYHFIKATDLANLTKAIKNQAGSIDTITGHNNRNLFALNTKVYRNWNDVDKLTPRATLLAYSSSSFVNVSYITVMSLIFFSLMIIF